MVLDSLVAFTIGFLLTLVVGGIVLLTLAFCVVIEVLPERYRPPLGENKK